jgi:hypothetical protein
MFVDAVMLASVFTVCLLFFVLVQLLCFDSGKILPQPSLFLKQLGRDQMVDTLTYVVTANAPTDADVVQRELIVTINGEVKATTVFPGSAVDLGVVTAPQDADVKLTLIDVDDVGNKSLPAEFYFTAVDTIPPNAPGGFTVTLVGENTNS